MHSVAPLHTWPGNAGHSLSLLKTKDHSEVRRRAHDLNPQTVRDLWPVLLPGNHYSSSSPVPINQERRERSRGAGREREKQRENVCTVRMQNNISMSSRQQLRTSSRPEEETLKDQSTKQAHPYQTVLFRKRAAHGDSWKGKDLPKFHLLTIYLGTNPLSSH